MTQAEQAAQAITTIRAILERDDLRKALEALGHAVDESQNEPFPGEPGGRDGSIDEATWYACRDLRNDLEKVYRHFR